MAISAGNDVTDRGINQTANRTYVDNGSTVTGDGTITEIQLWATGDLTGIKVGFFHLVSGTNTFFCRDFVSLGDTTGAGLKTFSGLDIKVKAGDRLGWYCASGNISVSSTGSSAYGAGDSFGAESVVTISFTYNYTTSIYASGTDRPELSSFSKIATADSYINQAAADTNYGSGTTLSLYNRNENRNRRALLYFPVTWGTDVPVGAVIHEAIVTLNVTLSQNTTNTWMYKVSNTGWVESEVTWNSYATGNAWTAAGGDYVTSSPFGWPRAGATGALTWDITDIVLDAQANSLPINLLWRKQTENNLTSNYVTTATSREGTTEAERPFITIYYEGGSAPPSGFTFYGVNCNKFCGVTASPFGM